MAGGAFRVAADGPVGSPGRRVTGRRQNLGLLEQIPVPAINMAGPVNRRRPHPLALDEATVVGTRQDLDGRVEPQVMAPRQVVVLTRPTVEADTRPIGREGPSGGP